MNNVIKAVRSVLSGFRKSIAEISSSVNAVTAKLGEFTWFPTENGYTETKWIEMGGEYRENEGYYITCGLVGVDTYMFAPGQKMAVYFNGKRYEGIVSKTYNLFCGPGAFSFWQDENAFVCTIQSGKYLGDSLHIELAFLNYGDNKLPVDMLPDEISNKDYVSENIADLKNRSTMKHIDQNFEFPKGGNWCSIAYGDGRFVAVKNNSDIVAESGDGFTWRCASPGMTYVDDVEYRWHLGFNSATSITYGNGKFVVVGSNTDVVSYSTGMILNGKLAWRNSKLPAARDWRCVTYGNGMFIAIAYNSDRGAYSHDGIVWEEFTLPSAEKWTSIAYETLYFVAVTEDSKYAYFFMNHSGSDTYPGSNINHWKLADVQTSSYKPLTGLNIAAVVPSFGSTRVRFVAFARGTDKVLSSTQFGCVLRENSNLILPSEAEWCAACCRDDKIVVIAANSDMVAVIDGNEYGASTIAAGKLPFSAEWSAVCYGDGKFIAIASGTSKFAVSNDGINWVASYTGYVQNGKFLGDFASPQYVDDKISQISVGGTNSNSCACGDITETTTTNKIEWDGVVGDKVTGEIMVGGIMAIPLVRVSDYVPDVSVFTEQGITISGTFEGNTQEFPIDAEEVENSIIHAENCYTMELFAVALEDNVVAHIQTDVDSTITLPKKGVYFIQDNEVMSMRSLSSPLLEVPYYKVKPEALPDNIGGDSKIVVASLDLQTMKLDKTLDEINDLVVAGNLVLCNLTGSPFTVTYETDEPTGSTVSVSMVGETCMMLGLDFDAEGNVTGMRQGVLPVTWS